VNEAEAPGCGACPPFAANGPSGCPNRGLAPYNDLVASILAGVASINPDKIRQLYSDELAKVQSTTDELATQIAVAKRAVAEASKRIDRLLDAIEQGDLVTDRLKDRQREREAKKAALEALEARQAATAGTVDWEAWAGDVQVLVARLRHPAQHELPACRQVLKVLFPEPVEVSPPQEGALAPGWRWRATVNWEDASWRQIVLNAPAWITQAEAEEEMREDRRTAEACRPRSSARARPRG
jgi:hypothetical protein